MMKKIYVIGLTLCLFIFGYNDAISQTSTVGNTDIPSEQLPAQNEAAIRSDFKLIKTIMINATDEANTTNKLVSEAKQKNDKQAVKSLITKYKDSLISTTKSLNALHMKSQEVQMIRNNLVHANVMAIGLHDLALKEDLTEKDKRIFLILTNKAIELQKKINQDINELSVKYKDL